MRTLLINSLFDLYPAMADRNRGTITAVEALGPAPRVSGAAGGAGAAQGAGGGNAETAQGFVMLPYPIGANRVWRQAKGRVIPNAKAEAWKRVATIMVREAGIGFFEAGVHVHYKLHPRTNKDGSASAIRLDVDAPAKALLDAFNGVIWNDDKQVLRLVGEVSHPVEGGGLSVMVTPC